MPSPSPDAFLRAAARAAFAARHSVTGHEDEAPVALGADGAPTEAADRAAEMAALEHLLPLELPIVSEEAGHVGPPLDPDGSWISLDPLDGSRNFRAGLPPWATAIALVQHGEPLAGLVLEHTTGRCWRALRGGGARLGDRPLERRTTSRLLGLPSTRHAIAEPPPGYDRVRIVGATTVDLCHVAEGTLAAYLGLAPAVAHVHDLAAPLVILREAGATVLLADGTEPRLDADPRPTYPLVAAGSPEECRALLESRWLIPA
jgi:3'(2'), 5'-bisphosphate nucleotidase